MPAKTSVATHPHRTRLRTRCPMSAGQDPTATLFSTATHPDESGIGSGGNNLHLRRRRRVGGDDFDCQRRRGLHMDRAVAIDHLAFHAAGK